MTSDELNEDYCFDAIDNQTKAVYPKDYVDAAIAELKAENQRLVKCCKEYESRLRIEENITFNGAEQLRATKRALWLARAYRGYDNSILLPSKFMRKVWDCVERKCRAKAEEYE